MDIKTIDDIFAFNDAVRRELLDTLANVPTDHLTAPVEGEKWRIIDVVEHVSLVNSGATRICAKLLSRAATREREDRDANISGAFLEHLNGTGRTKMDAPDIVQPSGKLTLGEILASLASSKADAAALLEKFITLDHTAQSFPHPYFGNLSAAEWLYLTGLHERRHTDQIRRFAALSVPPR